MKHKIMGKVLCGILVLPVLALFGCGKKPPAPEAPTAVQVEKIQTGLQSAAFTYAGDVRGRYESQFAFQAGGRIQARLVSNGDSVKAGQALMQMDMADLKTQLDRSRAALRGAQADYKLAEVSYARYSSCVSTPSAITRILRFFARPMIDSTIVMFAGEVSMVRTKD